MPGLRCLHKREASPVSLSFGSLFWVLWFCLFRSFQEFNSKTVWLGKALSESLWYALEKGKRKKTTFYVFSIYHHLIKHVTLPNLKMRKFRSREVKWLGQGPCGQMNCNDWGPQQRPSWPREQEHWAVRQPSGEIEDLPVVDCEFSLGNELKQQFPFPISDTVIYNRKCIFGLFPVSGMELLKTLGIS